MKTATFGIDASVMTSCDAVGTVSGKIEVEGTPSTGCALRTTNTEFLTLAFKFDQQLIVSKILHSPVRPLLALSDLKFAKTADALRFLDEVTEIEGLVGDPFD
jgi:hypothetical protein